MNDIPTPPPDPESPHAWVHENLAAYLAGALEPDQRERFDAHINACADCFDAFTEARDADRTLQRTLGTLVPDTKFEDRLITAIREKSMKRTTHLFIRRTTYATAACVALAATGVFANYALHQNGRFNNPLSERLVATADKDAPGLGREVDRLAAAFVPERVVQAVDEVNSSKYAAIVETVHGMAASTQPASVDAIRKKMEAVNTWAFVTPEAHVAELNSRVTQQLATNRDSDQKQLADRLPSIRGIPSAPASTPSPILAKPEEFQKTSQSSGIGGALAYDDASKQKEDLFRFGVAADGTAGKKASADPSLQNGTLDAAKQAQFDGGGAKDSIQFSNAGLQAGGQQAGPAAITKGLGEEKEGLKLQVAKDIAVSGKMELSPELSYSVGAGVSKSFSGGIVLSEGGFTINGGRLITGSDAPKAPQSSNESVASLDSGFARLGTLATTGSLTLSNGGTVSKLTDPNLTHDESGIAANTGVPGSATLSGNITNTNEKAASTDLRLDANHQAVPTFNHRLSQDELDKLGKSQTNINKSTSDLAPQVARLNSQSGAEPQNQRAAAEMALRKLQEQSATGGGSPNDPAKPGITSPVAAPPAPASAAQPTAPAAAQTPAAQPAPDVATRKIIRNGTVEFEVRSFDDTYATVATVVAENGGFVSSTSSDKLANGKVRGNIVVRVPPERLDRFLLELRALGDLKSQQIAANDVTKEYTDIASELRGLRTMEGRLIDLIKTGKGEVKDLVEAEKQLGEYRIRIEKLEGEISYYNNLVGMATINITAYEKDIQKPTAAAEQENVNVSVETEEVEAKYQAARKILDDAKGRIVESQLKNTDAEHVAASIVADIPPDKADFVADQLKQLGKVASYNRDRRQTTTGGPGAPLPNTQIEHKDTRFSISLYNLANLAPRQTTLLRIAVRDVQETYRQTLSAVRKDLPAAGPAAPAVQLNDNAAPHATGRVLSSNLTGQRPEEMAATVVAEVRADQSDAVLQLLRDSGEVLASSLATNPDNVSTTSAKRGVQVTLVNFASVSPKEIDTLNIAVRDVDDAYKKLLALVRQDIPAPAAGQSPANPLLPPTTGRILASNVNGQQPEQMTADIRAELRSDQAQRVLDAVRASGEVLNSTSTETPDAGNSTLAKRGLQVRFINVAAIAARENQSLRLVAQDVPDAYAKLLASLQTLQTAGNARVISSQLNQSDARNVAATLAFEARRDSVPAVEKAFKDAGIDFLSRNITRSTDTAGTLDTKIHYQIDSLISAESLEPRSTTVLSVEVDDVDKAMESIRGAASGTPAKEVDYNLSRDQTGRVIGRIVLDAPVSNIPALLDRARHLGTEKVNQVVKNPQVPETRFAKERIELTIASREGIVQSDKGLWPTMRAALSSAAGALLYSMYLVVTGVLFILPFALIIWVGWAVIRRRKAAAT